MARFQVKYKQNWSASRVITKIVLALLGLYVGGTIITEVGKVMVNTSNGLNKGLTLIGWTVGAQQTNASGSYATTCGGTTYVNGLTPLSTCITSTSGSGILAVIGIVAIASVVMEFVEIRMK